MIWLPGIVQQRGTRVRSVTKHGHPTDRRQLAAVFDEARRTGEPFSAQQRILAADESTRAVVVVGDVDTEAGETIGVHGYYVDLTTARVREAEQLSELAGEAAGLQRAMASRATIEQAKGMIMLPTGTTREPRSSCSSACPSRATSSCGTSPTGSSKRSMPPASHPRRRAPTLKRF